MDGDPGNSPSPPPQMDIDPNTLPFRRRSPSPNRDSSQQGNATNGRAPLATRPAEQPPRAPITSTRLLLIFFALSWLFSLVKSGLWGQKTPSAASPSSEDALWTPGSPRLIAAQALVEKLRAEAEKLGEERGGPVEPIVFNFGQSGKLDLASFFKEAQAKLAGMMQGADISQSQQGTMASDDGKVKLTFDLGGLGANNNAGTGAFTIGEPKLETTRYDECLVFVAEPGVVIESNSNDTNNSTAVEERQPGAVAETGFCAIYYTKQIVSEWDEWDDSSEEGLVYLSDHDKDVSWDYSIIPEVSPTPRMGPEILHGSRAWKEHYRDKVKTMFFHAFGAYLRYAYPKDELKPLSCVGVDNMGGIQATLIDTLDTLAILNETDLFQSSIRLARHVDFDVDEVVSVFESNIRILGGLLSAHILAQDLLAESYNGFLLDRAYDIGRRLLKAFTANSGSGMPYGSVNLRHGVQKGETDSTCTACVGTYALEFGWLSLLTGDKSFEKAARKAIRSLTRCATPLGLYGGHINISSGEWIHAEASVGADSDSFYEYLFKAYFTFADETEYGDLAAQALEGIRAHLQKGVWHFDVNAATAQTVFPWHHSLSAFLPGLKVLRGDLVEAQDGIWSSKMVMDRSGGFLPEQFNLQTAMLMEGRNHYPLRPEFVESLWYLHRATDDPWLLDWAARFVLNLESKTRVACGYAGLANVASGELADRMDSFLLSETLKYLYLIFDEDNEFNDRKRDWVFTTEAHPLPVTDRRGWKQGKWHGVDGRKTQARATSRRPSRNPVESHAGRPLPGIRDPDPESSPFFSAIHMNSVASYRDRSRTAWENKVCDYGEWQEAVEARIWGRSVFGSRLRG